MQWNTFKNLQFSFKKKIDQEQLKSTEINKVSFDICNTYENMISGKYRFTNNNIDALNG